MFLVSLSDTIKFFNMNSYKEMPDLEIKIDVPKSATREQNEIISMQKTISEEFVGVLIGKKLKKNLRMPSQLLIFKKE